MADTGEAEYRTQVISQRYIKNNVLEGYVEGKVVEFGANWAYTVWIEMGDSSRDNKISFSALRQLTEAELDHLEDKSYGEKSLFV